MKKKDKDIIKIEFKFKAMDINKTIDAFKAFGDAWRNTGVDFSGGPSEAVFHVVSDSSHITLYWNKDDHLEPLFKAIEDLYFIDDLCNAIAKELDDAQKNAN